MKVLSQTLMYLVALKKVMSACGPCAWWTDSGQIPAEREINS